MSNLNPKEIEALQHWSLFGQRGTPPTKRVTAEGWKVKPFSRPVTSTWNQKIPRAELPKLLNGFRPGAMEDKWFVYADGPDTQGNASLHMFRSWTGNKMFEVRLVVEVDGSGELADKDACFTEITWESDGERITGQTEDKAKGQAMEVCNWCMGVQLNDQLP